MTPTSMAAGTATATLRLAGRELISGSAQGELLFSDVGLSFWGGVDAASGEVIDRHHPLRGESLAGRVLAIPRGRGSCTGSSVLLELILNGHAPAALVFAEADEILTLGVMVAEALFERSLPVLCLDDERFERLRGAAWLRLEDACATRFAQPPTDGWTPRPAPPWEIATVDGAIGLCDDDRAVLEGLHGKAAQAAMRIVLRMAGLQGASELVEVSQAHIDGCIYTGPASLEFAQRLLDWGARVRVPTTLNAISVDQRRWRSQGVDPAFAEPASRLGDVYLAMGAQPSFTCAPYLLDTAPKRGEQIAWAESNAVVYANSVLGARSQKYPDFLDICIALVGRAPNAGGHLDEGRLARLRIDFAPPSDFDDALYPLLGYQVGLLSGADIPVIQGLAALAPGSDELKAFGAAFATTSAAPMFHIVGVTPEAADLSTALGGIAPERTLRIGVAELVEGWHALNLTAQTRVTLVALGNPHFSLSECVRLAELCAGRRKHPQVAMIVTCSRATLQHAERAGHVAMLEAFGAQFVTDTCWCMIQAPLISPPDGTLITNSAKYAHYAPGLVDRQIRFASLSACVEAACSGEASALAPAWLVDADHLGGE